MTIPYRARVNERWFLNLPGFHGGAYVMAFVEDTSECGPQRQNVGLPPTPVAVQDLPPPVRCDPPPP